MKKFLFMIMAVAMPCALLTSCGDDDITSNNGSNQEVKKTIVGTWKQVDDGDVHRLIFWQDGTGKRTWNGRVVDENGYDSSLGNFDWIQTSQNYYRIVFRSSGMNVDVIWNGGDNLMFGGSIYYRQ